MSDILKDQLVAVVDDEKEVRDVISRYLSDEGCIIKTFPCGESLIEYLKKEIPDILLLDRMLPEMDGIMVCQKIRDDERVSQIPILMFSGKGEVLDKITGLNIGADDYLPKPFDLEELKARMMALLRRSGEGGQEATLKIGGDLLSIDKKRYQVTVEGKKVTLTYAEYKILELLASKKGQVFSRNRILEYVWSDEKMVVERTVDFHIVNLRKKIRKAGSLIKNVRGFGYVLDETEEY